MGRDAVRLHRAEAGREGDAGGYHRLVPQEPRRLQMPALRRVRRTAADLDRKNPEIQAARHGEDGVTMASRAVATGIGVNPSSPRKRNPALPGFPLSRE